MHKLLSTTEDAGHHHVVYIDDQAGTGVVTPSQGHTHNIAFIQPPPGPMGPDGQPTPPAGPGTWQIQPAIDGHTHTLVEYEPKPVVETQTDEEVVSEVVSLYKNAAEIDGPSMEAGEESEKFYLGDQWEPALKSDLESKKRACLVFNYTQRNIDELCGHQRQLRTDLRYLPTGEGDQRIADVLNILSKHVLEQCFFEREESKAFEDTAIPGRGLLNVYVDHNADLRGQPKVEQFPWRDAVFGRHAKEDLSDCEYFVKHRMYSLGKVKSLWPDVADQITVDYRDYVEQTGTHHQSSTDQYLESANRTPTVVGGHAMVDIARKELRVLECWRRMYMPSAVAVDGNTEEMFSLFGWSKPDVKAVGQIPGLYVIEQVVTKIRITRICGSTLLGDERPADLPVDDFFMIPIYAHKRGDKWWGKVEIAKDPQREINKRRSQAIDIGNRMAAYGWFYDQGTFPTPDDKDRFLKNSSTPGFTQLVSNVNAPPKQVEGVQFPSELANLIQMAAQDHSTLMNISIAPENGDSPGAILEKQRLRLVGNEFLFDSLSFAKKKLGRLLAAIFQRFFSPERIWRILYNANMKGTVTLAGQNFEETSKQELIDLLQTADFVQYDVVVSESQWSPSERTAVMLLLKDMQAGPDILIPLANIPEDQKQKILAGFQQQQATQAETENKKSEVELQKTLIAKGYIPPKVLQEQGLAPPTAQQPPQPGAQPNGMPVNQNEQGGLSGLM